jgi:mono/diheme cytochrome c family protein
MPRLLASSVAVLVSLAVAPALHAAPSRSAQRGLAFAEARCAACHAIRADRTSPDPEAPSFETIANRPGVTRSTLRRFLRDSHNFPDAMSFRVDARRIGELADHIATLRRPGYRPVM